MFRSLTIFLALPSVCMKVTSVMRHFEESVDLALYFLEQEMHTDGSGGLTHKIVWKPTSHSLALSCLFLALPLQLHSPYKSCVSWLLGSAVKHCYKLISLLEIPVLPRICVKRLLAACLSTLSRSNHL